MKSALLTAAWVSCVVVATMLGALTVTGCTTIKNPDGTSQRVLGFDSPEAQQKAQDTVNTIATYLPPPFNTIAGAIGTAVVAGIGSYAAKKKGEEIGWDTAHQESPALSKDASTAPTAPKPPA